MIKYFLIILLVVYYVMYASYERCKYVMYGRSSCPYCVHMKKQIGEDGMFKDFRYIEITTHNGRNEFEKHSGGESVGVPMFVNARTGKKVVGAMDTATLISELEQTEFKDVIMYGSMGCGYTVKMIDELKKHEVWESVTFVDTDTPDGKESFDEIGVSGVPYMVHPNGRSAHGYMPFHELVKQFRIG